MKIRCPNCKQPVKVPAGYEGREIACPHCKTRFKADPPPPDIVRNKETPTAHTEYCDDFDASDITVMGVLIIIVSVLGFLIALSEESEIVGIGSAILGALGFVVLSLRCVVRAIRYYSGRSGKH